MADILIGNVKGPQGVQGETGAQGAQGDAATIQIGSTTTVPYGQAARVTNSGTESEAVFNFVIPQGRPGEQTTKIDNLTIDAITEPSTQFPVPAVGDNGSTLFGKITKWFSDMSALVATKLNASAVVNNLTTTASGYALDARQGKALGDQLDLLGTLDAYYPSQTNVGTSSNVNLVNTDSLSPGTYIIYASIMAGGTNSDGSFAEVRLYREQDQTFLLQINPYTKYVNIAVPTKVTTASRFFLMAKAATAGTVVYQDNKINYMKVLRIK